jgi:hypothetical protein
LPSVRSLTKRQPPGTTLNPNDMMANLVIYLEDVTPEALSALHHVVQTHNLAPNSRIEGYGDQECTFDYCDRLALTIGAPNDFFDI